MAPVVGSPVVGIAPWSDPPPAGRPLPPARQRLHRPGACSRMPSVTLLLSVSGEVGVWGSRCLGKSVSAEVGVCGGRCLRRSVSGGWCLGKLALPWRQSAPCRCPGEPGSEPLPASRRNRTPRPGTCVSGASRLVQLHWRQQTTQNDRPIPIIPARVRSGRAGLLVAIPGRRVPPATAGAVSGSAGPAGWAGRPPARPGSRRPGRLPRAGRCAAATRRRALRHNLPSTSR